MNVAESTAAAAGPAPQTTTYDNIVTYDRDPQTYRHWSLDVDGDVATLTLKVDEDGGLRPGYKLKLNSYDLGVDMELHDAVQRIRFEHPTVKVVVLTSGLDRMFCAGANIYMLGTSSHGWKVNFCKFTNETRNGLEDSSRSEGLKFLAACNGVTAGGGYEVALACDEILLVDDRSSAVSLPEVPLLGVLPGTGGLTRITDKRKVRRDLADVFCTSEEGVRGKKAKDWGLVDDIATSRNWDEKVAERVAGLRAKSTRPDDAVGVSLPPVAREISDTGYRYTHVDVEIDDQTRVATITVKAPEGEIASSPDEILAEGAAWYPLAMARELDDAILMLRTNNEEAGVWLLKTSGDAANVLAMDAVLAEHEDNWFVKETIAMLRRTLSRLDVSSRSMFAVVDEGSCFAGTFMEMALAADRVYMLDLPDDPDAAPTVALSSMNFGAYYTIVGNSRLSGRFYDDESVLEDLKTIVGRSACRPGGRGTRPGHLHPRRHRLGRRNPHRGRGTHQPFAGRADRHGGEPALRRAGTMLTRIFGRLPPGRTGYSSGPTRWVRRARSSFSAPAPRPISTSGGFDANRPDQRTTMKQSRKSTP